MHLKSLVPTWLALVVMAGCQSYFPNGYGYNGPYSAFPSGTYVAPGATSPSGSRPSANSAQAAGQYPTPVAGQLNSVPDQTRGQSPRNSKSVPEYRSPNDAPANLGAPASGDELDSIKRGSSSLGNPGGSADDGSDEPDESLSSRDDEKFVSPAVYRSGAAGSDDGEPRRLAAKPRPSPYKKDPNGYSWLRGVVARDPKTKSWRIIYSRNAVDGDPYGGSLTLIDDESLDVLIDDDVIFVAGSIDESIRDRFGKPCYRVQKMEPLVPKEN